MLTMLRIVVATQLECFETLQLHPIDSLLVPLKDKDCGQFGGVFQVIASCNFNLHHICFHTCSHFRLQLDM